VTGEEQLAWAVGPEPRLAPDLGRFYRDAVAYELVGDGTDPTVLWPEEAEAVARAVANRVRQFAAGRHCARAAMAELGLAPAAVPVGERRAPRWPVGLRGSISHTDGYAVAVVRRVGGGEGDRWSVGIDAEQVGRVTEHLHPRLFTPAEQQWLAALAPLERAWAAAAVFGAKEAFYKAQFPLTAAWVGFHDVGARRVEAGLILEPCTDLPALAQVQWPCLARHANRGPIVVSAVEVEGLRL
jgi:4'-phosphopantetheinyl transferase EntD